MTKLSLTSTVELNNGRQLPRLGFGVWDSPKNLTTQSCTKALGLGYRHIDTAQVYGNEVEVGAAVQKSDLKREDIFVTSKILMPKDDVDETYRSCLQSVRSIAGKDGYLDLMLIHNATSGAKGIKMIWQALERLVDEGKIKSIGVSNTGKGLIEGMRDYAKIWPPAVNQLELHPWCQQHEIVNYCHKNAIAVEAYCPLVRNQKGDDKEAVAIAKKHGKTVAQVLLRYSLQKGWIPLPKSDNPDRIKQNADLYDFEISDEDMKALDSKDEGRRGALVTVADNERTT